MSSHPDPERLWSQRLPWWLAAAAVLAWLAAFAPDLQPRDTVNAAPPARFGNNGAGWPAPTTAAADPADATDESGAAIAAREGFTRNTP